MNRYRIDPPVPHFVDRYLARLDRAEFKYKVVEDGVIECSGEPPTWGPVSLLPVE